MLQTGAVAVGAGEGQRRWLSAPIQRPRSPCDALNAYATLYCQYWFHPAMRLCGVEASFAHVGADVQPSVAPGGAVVATLYAMITLYKKINTIMSRIPCSDG